MKRIYLLVLTGIFLIGCGSSNPTEDTTDQTTIDITVDVNIKLSTDETNELDPGAQGGFDSFINEDPLESTYHHKTNLTIYDSEESAHELDIYFFLTSTTARTWEVRTKLDGTSLTAVDINENGEDAEDQKLLFNNEGQLDTTTSTNSGIIQYITNSLNVEQINLNFSIDTHENEGDYTLSSIWISLEGKGFFVTSSSVTSDDKLFTRIGDFRLRTDGYVVNRYDEPLMVFPVNRDGTVSATSLNSREALQIQENTDTVTATTKIKIGVNLPEAAVGLDPNDFNSDEAITYNASTSISIVDSLGETHVVTFYYVKVDGVDNSWAQYLELDGTALDIESGTSGAGSQLYGTIEFDNAGNLRYSSDRMITIAMPFTNGADQTQQLFIDYRSNSTTQFASGFAVTRLSHDGFGGQLSVFDISDEGIIRAYYTNGTSAALGKIALAYFLNPQDLISKEGTTSLLESIDGEPIAGEAKSAFFGTIDTSSLKASNPIYSEYPYNISITGEGYFVTSKEFDSQQFNVSTKSSYRTDRDGFVINQYGEYLRFFHAVDGDIFPIIESLELSAPMQIPASSGSPRGTSEVSLGVNLPSTSTALNVLQFDPDNPETFNAGTGLTIVDSLGESHTNTFYFLKDNSGINQWVVYVFIDDNPVDIIGGMNGANGQLYGLLNFDNTGTFQSILPIPLSYITVFTNGADPNQLIEVIFDTSTELPSSFAVFTLEEDSFGTGQFSSIDIDEKGIITIYWTNNKSSIRGWIPLVTMEDTSCLLSINDSESLMIAEWCSYTTAVPGSTGFGTIDFSFDEFE